jgi:hypothetical protein
MVVADLFCSAQLDLALGRANVIHAALTALPASAAFLKRVRRLAVYRDRSAEATNRPKPAEPALANRSAAAQETVLEPRLPPHTDDGHGPGT